MDFFHDLPEPASMAVHLLLVSHAHSPPFSPAPALKLDLRRVTNPPKHIRDAYDGRSKRLREHLLHEDVFVNLLGTAEADIRAEMEKLFGSASGESPHSLVLMRLDEV